MEPNNLDQRLRTSYADRVHHATNPLTQQLFELMEEKQSNLCLANDETDPQRFLEICSQTGPEVVVMKTHVDVLTDFNPMIIKELRALAQKHHFFIFEDRKFADIGNTVAMQYAQGVYKIAEWSHLTNAHAVPGPGIIEGLQSVAKEQSEPRGLLLLAQMSSKGSLATDEYTVKTVAMANDYPDFVIGFIGNGGQPDELKKLASIAGPQFIIATPGINLAEKGDGLKQQYGTPESALANGSDIIIVGRGIYKAANPQEAAKQYREAGWKAYLGRK